MATRVTCSPRPLAKPVGPLRAHTATATTTVNRIISNDSCTPRVWCFCTAGSWSSPRSEASAIPLIRAIHTDPSAMSVSAAVGQRVRYRHLGSAANTIANSPARGAKTTAACRTSACRGSPSISMEVRLNLHLAYLKAQRQSCPASAVGLRGPPSPSLERPGHTLRPMSPSYTDDLRLAHVLADDADSLSTSRFRAQDLHVVTKPDLTPVSDADRSVEEGIRRTLSRARPRDAVVGEEEGSTGHSQRRWVVDPIDGTKNYV